MNNEQRVLDEIDALVDAQLQQEPSGYDHNLNQDKCEWCGDDWHALAITQRLKWARRYYQMTLEMPADYDYSTDESPVLCEGADFVGPRISHRLRGELKASIAKRRELAYLLGKAENMRDQLDGSHIGPLPKWLTETRGPAEVDELDEAIQSAIDSTTNRILEAMRLPPLVMFPNPLLPRVIQFDEPQFPALPRGMYSALQQRIMELQPSVWRWQSPDNPFDETEWRTVNPTLGHHEVTIRDGAPYVYGEHFQLDEGSRVGYQDRDGEIHYGRVVSHQPSSNDGWTITIGDDIPPVARNVVTGGESPAWTTDPETIGDDT